MSPALSYPLAVLIGFFAGLVGSAHLTLSLSSGASVIVLYGLSLLLFLIGVDALLTTEHVRSFLRNARPFGRHAGIFLLTFLGTLTVWMALSRVSLTAGRVAAAALGRSAEATALSTWLTLVPVLVFLAVFAVVAVIEFAAAGQRWWGRVRGWIVDDWRGRAGLVLVAALIDAAIFSVWLGEFEFLWLVLLYLAALAVMPLLDRALARSRLWAVARQTLAEALHYKVVVVWVVAMLLLIIVMPQAVAGDGLTLKSRVQSYLNFALLTVGVGLSLLTVGLATYTLPNEIVGKQIFMTTSKPIPRWQIVAGKWLGIGVLNTGLLLFSGGAVWGFTEYMRKQPTSVPDDRKALEAEVLSVRHSVPLAEPPDLLARAQQIVRQQREEGRIRPDQEAEQIASKLQELRQTWKSLGPGKDQVYQFKNLMVDRTKPGEFLHIRLKPNSNSGVDDLIFRIRYMAGDPDEVNTQPTIREMEIPAERVTTLVVPAFAVNSEGTLKFRMMNLNSNDVMTFEEPQSFELLYGIGTFHWNLVRALAILWCRLAFIAAMGLLFSSFLSFPVAFLTTTVPFLIAAVSGFIGEALDAAARLPGGKDPIWGPLQLGRVLVPLGKAVVWLLPDFSKYDAVENVVDGQLVPLMWVLMSFGKLVLFGCLILGVVGCAVFTSRELAKEGA